MPMQPGPLDPGNPHLSDQPWSLVVTPMETPVGPRIAVTLRVGNATVSAIVSRDDAISMGARIDQVASAAPKPSGLIVPPTVIPRAPGDRP